MADPSIKTRLCQQYASSGGNHTACPFFAQHGWCRFAHGEHELHIQTRSLVALRAPSRIVTQPLPGAARHWSFGSEGKRKLEASNGSTFKVAKFEHELAPKLENARMKTRLCQQFVDGFGNDLACPHFSRHGWCAYAHGEHELGTKSATSPPEQPRVRPSAAPSQQNDMSIRIDSGKRKTKICQPFADSGGLDDSACPHFARHGWCAYAHGEHELEDYVPRHETIMAHTLASDASDKLIARKRKTKLCQPFQDSGGDDASCPHFARHGWCAYAHGEHELEHKAELDARTEAVRVAGFESGDLQSSLADDVEHRVSTKLNAARMKSRMCQQYVDSGGHDSACPHFVRHGWCAYAHGEHEMEEYLQAATEMRGEDDALTNEIGLKVSPKLAASRLKTRLCQQWLDGGRLDTSCVHFSRHGWCAYAHGEHEIEEPATASNSHAVYSEASRHHDGMDDMSQDILQMSAKLDPTRIKTRLCQQFLDGGRVDSACLHFARHGWCAYAHGEHEMSGVESFREEPVQQQHSQVGHEVSAKLDSTRMKTRLCQQFMNSGGNHDACPHFVRHGWCAYAHGDHELDKLAPSSSSSYHTSISVHRQPLPPLIAPQASAKLDPARRKTRLCQQFVDSGGQDSACPHFAQLGWCAYAHGEHELEGGVYHS